MANGRRTFRPSSQTAQGRSRHQTFQDTVLTILDSTTTDTNVFSAKELLPSLISRTVVFERFVVEFLPSINVDSQTILANIFINSDNQGDTLIASGPFKILSATNPTRFVVDVRREAKRAPGILFPIKSDSDTTFILSTRINRALVAPESIQLRITSHVVVWPQDGVIPA